MNQAMKLQVITSFSAPEIKLEQIRDKLASDKHIYFMPEKDALTWARTLRQSEKETSSWIRRYENMYQGLKYWRGKALEK